jgi:hypothetical protein
LDVGNSNKKQADNKINDKSSRSHTVFRIELKISEENIQTRRKVINSILLANSDTSSKTD